MRFPLTSIKCGNDKIFGMWVSVGYRSKDGEQHVLHIVAGEDANAKPIGRSLVPIYFERDDQSLSCYDGANKILVGGNSIAITLNKNGRASLELPAQVEFVLEKPGRDFAKAKVMFTKMKDRHGGEPIRVA